MDSLSVFSQHLLSFFQEINGFLSGVLLIHPKHHPDITPNIARLARRGHLTSEDTKSSRSRCLGVEGMRLAPGVIQIVRPRSPLRPIVRGRWSFRGNGQRRRSGDRPEPFRRTFRRTLPDERREVVVDDMFAEETDLGDEEPFFHIFNISIKTG